MHWWLTANTSSGVFVVNRYSLSGGPVLNFDGSDEITVEQIEGDLATLFNRDWPAANDPQLGFPGGYPQEPGRRYGFVAGINSLFHDDGSTFFQLGGGGRGPSCAYAENLLLPYGVFGGVPNCTDWPLDRSQRAYSQVRAQVLTSAGASHCLYDIVTTPQPGTVSCLDLFETPHLNCRRVSAGDDGIIEIPLPPLGMRTYFDEFCDCENQFP